MLKKCPIENYCRTYTRWEPNDDIAGTGKGCGLSELTLANVLIGFVGTAYIVFALVLAHYFVAYDPEVPPPPHLSIQLQLESTERQVLRNRDIETNQSFSPSHWAPNPIDVRLLAWLRSQTRKVLDMCNVPKPVFGATRSQRIQSGFNHSILSMCDIQTITGISVLASGFICMLDNRLSAMHWQIIVYLAWFSCVTHMSGLTVLRRHLQKELWAKCARLALTLVLLFTLIVAMAPTAFFNWERGIKTLQDSAAIPPIPVICFFSIGCGKYLYEIVERTTPFSHTSAFVEMLISQMLISGGFLARAFKLSTRLSEKMHQILIIPCANLVHRGLGWLGTLLFHRSCAAGRTTTILDSKSFRHSFILRPVLAALILFRTQADLFNSMLGEIFWLCVILLWGTSKLFVAAFRARVYNELLSDSSPQSPRWQFGQVLPMLLLAAPLITLFSSFFANLTCTNCRINNMETVQDSTPSTDRSQRTYTHEPSLPIAAAPVATATSGNTIATDRNDNRNHMSLLFAVSENVYRETQWVVPYLTSSLVVIVAHVYFLFRYATATFEAIFLLFNGLDSEPEWLLPLWTPTEYMFTETGVAYLVLLSYPFAGHATILVGLTALDWASHSSGAFGYHLRSGMFWLLTVVIYGSYTWIIYWDVIDSDWKIRAVILVSVVWYGLYMIACLVSRLECFR